MKKIILCFLMVLSLFTFNGCFKDPVIESITLTGSMVNKYSTSDRDFDYDEAKIIAKYSNDTKQDMPVTKEMLSNFDNSIGSHTATITYMGKTTTFTYVVSEKIKFTYGIKTAYLSSESSDIEFEAEYEHISISDISIASEDVYNPYTGTRDMTITNYTFENEYVHPSVKNGIYTLSHEKETLSFMLSIHLNKVEYSNDNNYSNVAKSETVNVEIKEEDIGTTKAILLNQYNDIFGLYLTIKIELFD